MTQSWRSGAAAIVVLLLAGCGGEQRLDVAAISGRVTYQGQGVSRATLVFIPEGEAAAKLGRMRPFAFTDGSGNFAVKTYVTGDGAPPGDYRVSIVVPVGPANPGGPVKDAPPDQSIDPSASRVAVPPSLVAKYGDAATSGLKVTIHDGQNELPPFEL